MMDVPLFDLDRIDNCDVWHVAQAINFGRVPEEKVVFATSLVRGYLRGQFSKKQEYWCNRLFNEVVA